MNLTTANYGPLAPYLLDLAAALAARDLELQLVGGAGLLLRRLVRSTGDTPTLLEELPATRTTEDLDVLLRLEVLEQEHERQSIRAALAELGYEPHLANLQFILTTDAGTLLRDVKVDFLAPEPDGHHPGLTVDPPRVKALQGGKAASLHGHVTPEAVVTTEAPLAVSVEGEGSDGTPCQVVVLLPHPFTLMVMKLHAFRDDHLGSGTHGKRPNYARKHVTDVYTLVALLTEEEAEALPTLGRQYAAHAAIQETGEIIRSLLPDLNGPGTLLLREAGLSPESLQVALDVLHETFSES